MPLSAPQFIQRMSESGFWNRDPNHWERELAERSAPASEDWDGLTRKAWGLYHTNQYRDAEALFKNVLDHAPDTFAADIGYFSVLRDGFRPAEAVRYFQDRWDREDKRYLYYYISRAWMKLGDAGQAGRHFHRWYDSDPTLDHFVALKARILSALGDWDQAADLFALILKQGVDQRDVSFLFVRAVAKAGGQTTVKSVLRNCARRLGASMPDAWLRYQAARYARCKWVAREISEDPTPSLQVPRGFPAVVADSNLNIRLIEGDADPRDIGGLSTPTVIRGDLVENIGAFRDAVRGVLESGRFDTWRYNIGKFREAFGSPPAPVIVLSTGRCGSYALQRFLEGAERVVPFHAVEWQMPAADRNHLLYRILAGAFDSDSVFEILQNYLECRMAEYLFAIRKNKALAITSHLDTVFAPFMAEILPESRFVHMYRDDAKVFTSMLTKRQWGDQLQHWRFDSSFPEGRFVFCADPGQSVEAEIAWYLHLTRTFVSAFFETIPDERKAVIRSEELFTQAPSAFERLKSVLPLDDITESGYHAAFARKINAKETFTDRAYGDISARIDRVRGVLRQLEQTGRFADERPAGDRRTPPGLHHVRHG